MRLERLDASGGDDIARLPITLAPLEEALSGSKDKMLRCVTIDPPPQLRHLAQITEFLHEAVPSYSLLSSSCWWLVRELSRSLVRTNSRWRYDLLNYCEAHELEQCKASYHPGGRGRVMRGVVLWAHAPIILCARPVVVVGSMTTFWTIKRILKNCREEFDRQVNNYLSIS